MEKFRLVEQQAYVTPWGDFPFLKGVEGKDWYGWRNHGKDDNLYFRGKPFGGVSFPVPEEGEILPVFGKLYRVSGNPKFLSRTFTLIKKDVLPTRLEIEKDSMIAPLRRDGIGRLMIGPSDQYVHIQIEKIESGEKGRLASGSAVIHKSDEKKSTTRTVPLKLWEGDAVTIDQWTFTVRRIVPKDFNGTKTVGWVEFGVEERKR